MKRILCLTLVVVFALSMLAGCGGTKSATEAAPSAEGTGTAPADAAAASESAVSKEPITFTLFSKIVNTNYENWESPVAKKITELTGVTLKEEFPVGDLSQKVGLMIASNEYPDFCYTSGKEQNQLIAAGAYIKLDELIEKYGPNIKSLYGDDLKRLRYTLEDPSIYYLGCYGVHAERWKPNMGFWIQHAVVKELGYPKLKTLEDAENVLKAYKEKHPTIDGKPTIALTTIAEDWRWQCAPGNMSAFVTGKTDDGNWYVDPKTFDATFRFYMPDHKLYYQWLNHMNAIGLLDPEAFVQKYDQYVAKLSSGRVLATNDQDWEMQDSLKAIRDGGNPERSYGVYPIQANERYVCADFQDWGYSGGEGVAITIGCKDPERAIQFLDWMASDEAQILNKWGIEGKDYIIKDGKRFITPEMWDERNNNKNWSKETGVGVYGYPFPERGDGQKDPTGQYYTTNTPEQLIANYLDVEKEVLAGYGVKMWKDLFPQADQLPKSPWGQAWQIPYASDSELAIIVKKCEDIMKQAIPMAVLAKPTEFDAVWAKAMEDLKAAGVEKANAEFSKLVKARIELWK
jgi:putative aldouronate transport system substrate-binding protein